MGTLQHRHQFDIDGAKEVAAAIVDEASKGSHRNPQAIISHRISLLELHAEQNPHIAARVNKTIKHLKEAGKA